jgi:hypothetical protein
LLDYNYSFSNNNLTTEPFSLFDNKREVEDAKLTEKLNSKKSKIVYKNKHTGMIYLNNTENSINTDILDKNDVQSSLGYDIFFRNFLGKNEPSKALQSEQNARLIKKYNPNTVSHNLNVSEKLINQTGLVHGDGIPKSTYSTTLNTSFDRLTSSGKLPRVQFAEQERAPKFIFAAA